MNVRLPPINLRHDRHSNRCRIHPDRNLERGICSLCALNRRTRYSDMVRRRNRNIERTPPTEYQTDIQTNRNNRTTILRPLPTSNRNERYSDGRVPSRLSYRPAFVSSSDSRNSNDRPQSPIRRRRPQLLPLPDLNPTYQRNTTQNIETSDNISPFDRELILLTRNRPSSANEATHVSVQPISAVRARTAQEIRRPPAIDPSSPLRLPLLRNNSNTNNTIGSDNVLNIIENVDEFTTLLNLSPEPTGIKLNKLNSCSKAIISSEENNEDMCCICQLSLKDEPILRKLECKHLFHLECIDKWFEEKNKCPVCRTNYS